jgi:amino acid permease
MIEWNIVAKVAGGGFGTTIFVLVIIALFAWVVGLIVQKTSKPAPEDKRKNVK